MENLFLKTAEALRPNCSGLENEVECLENFAKVEKQWQKTNTISFCNYNTVSFECISSITLHFPFITFFLTSFILFFILKKKNSIQSKLVKTILIILSLLLGILLPWSLFGIVMKIL